MKRLFSLCIISLIFHIEGNIAIGAESSKIDIFSVPYALQNKPKKDGERPECYPLYVNRISDCLPGKLYDVREAFTPQGIKFAENDFAWFSPDNHTLVVKASPDDMSLIDVIVNSTNYDPPLNVIISGQIRVDGGGDHKKSEEVHWRICTRSGQRWATSAKGGTALGYSVEIEPVVCADGEHIECPINLKITYGGREYAALASANIVERKQYTMMIGTTPRKEQIFFHLTPVLEWVTPAAPNDDPKKKRQMIECIKKHLSE